jgi:hypothetical protein
MFEKMQLPIPNQMLKPFLDRYLSQVTNENVDQILETVQNVIDFIKGDVAA